MFYQLTQRKGRKVQVRYSPDGKWESTGCDTKEEAIRLIESKTGILKFGTYAEGIYDMKNPLSIPSRDKARGKQRTPGTYMTKLRFLNNMIMPYFSGMNMQSITTNDVDIWMMTMKSRGKPASNDMRNIALSVLREIFRKAVSDGVIERNPASDVENFSAPQRRLNRITSEEVMTILPDDSEKLVGIWGNRQNALFMVLMRDTGFRPCEVCGLSKSSFRGNMVYTDCSMNQFEKGIVKRIKTTSYGQKYKVGEVSDTALELLSHMDEGLLFPKPSFCDYCNRLFKKVVRRMIDRYDISLYSLRGYFMTSLINKYPKELIMQLMGHRTWERCYDKRTPEEIMEQVMKETNRYRM